MSVTWNSSKHKSQASSKIDAGGERDHVAVGDLAARDILTKAINPLVNLGHEFVEVRAALVLDRAVLKKQIHQHGLAAPDLAVNVEAARRRLVLVRQTAGPAGLACAPACSSQAAARGRRMPRRPPPARRRARSRRKRRGLIMGAERGGGGDSMAPLRRQHGGNCKPRIGAGGYAKTGSGDSASPLPSRRCPR